MNRQQNKRKNNKLVATLMVMMVMIGMVRGGELFTKRVKTQSGSNSPVSISALQFKDQFGSQDSWNKYVEFYGSSTPYKGVFYFDLETTASTVSSYSLDFNFKGPTYRYQQWNFDFFVPSNNTWVSAGSNKEAANWSWTYLSFPGSVPFSSLVEDGKIKLRLSSTAGDNCDIDYLVIKTTEGEAAPTATPTTTPAPTPKATASPTTTPAPTTPATAAPTPKATASPTTTPAPTPKATAAPTTTPAPTAKATASPTTTPAPTPKATAAPTTTPAPTPKATAAPTTTPAPTPKATAAPTTTPAPTSTPKPTTSATTAPSTGGRICPAGQVWAPAPGTTWQWQLTGTIDQSLDVQMYDIDLFDTSASVISSLHSKGRAVICYFSTQYEDWRPDASKFTSDILGANLDDWPGERYVDIRSSKLRQIMTERLDLAVSKGCDGVEPDNVDGYSNSNGLGLTAANQLDYNKFLAQEAHKRGLSIGLKNDLAQVQALVSSFDWALNEQCNQYKECSSLNPFVAAGKAVFGVDYSGSASTICPAMVNSQFSWLMKSLSLGASGTQCCTYAANGCAKAAYRCITY